MCRALERLSCGPILMQFALLVAFKSCCTFSQLGIDIYELVVVATGTNFKRMETMRRRYPISETCFLERGHGRVRCP